MAAGNVPEDVARDATDCSDLFKAGRVTFVGSNPTVGRDVLILNYGITFGDNTSDFARDGECDDPRFVGAGVAPDSSMVHIERDADDCLAAYEIGQATLATSAPSSSGNGPNIIHSGIDFGDDTSQWANNGQCDDPRFEGPGIAAGNVQDDVARDGTDCSNLFNANQVWLIGQGGGAVSASPPSGVDFGNNAGPFADDGECDDARFDGPGMAANTYVENIGNDARDCEAQFNAGRVWLF